MFDTYRVTPRTEYVTREVHEHRAPTDDSIRLAKEYEEKIWKDVSNRVVVDIPSIDAAYIETEESCHDRARHIFFKINGHPVRVRFEHQYDLSKEKIILAIAEEITREVVTTLMMRRSI